MDDIIVLRFICKLWKGHHRGATHQGRPNKPQPCLSCGKTLRGSTINCPECGETFHRTCWKENGGCGKCGFAMLGRQAVPTDERQKATIVTGNSEEEMVMDWVDRLSRPIGSVFAAIVGIVCLQTLFIYHCPFVYHPTLTAMAIVAAPVAWFIYIDYLPPNEASKKER